MYVELQCSHPRRVCSITGLRQPLCIKNCRIEFVTDLTETTSAIIQQKVADLQDILWQGLIRRQGGLDIFLPGISLKFSAPQGLAER